MADGALAQGERLWARSPGGVKGMDPKPEGLECQGWGKRRELGILAENQKGLDGLLSSRKSCREKREV